MHQRMQSQLAEKLARDAAESSEKEEKVDLRGRVVKPRIDAWTQGKKVCLITHSHSILIRVLTLHTTRTDFHSSPGPTLDKHQVCKRAGATYSKPGRLDKSKVTAHCNVDVV